MRDSQWISLRVAAALMLGRDALAELVQRDGRATAGDDRGSSASISVVGAPVLLSHCDPPDSRTGTSAFAAKHSSGASDRGDRGVAEAVAQRTAAER
jgi:hypothetical protein